MNKIMNAINDFITIQHIQKKLKKFSKKTNLPYNSNNYLFIINSCCHSSKFILSKYQLRWMCENIFTKYQDNLQFIHNVLSSYLDFHNLEICPYIPLDQYTYTLFTKNRHMLYDVIFNHTYNYLIQEINDDMFNNNSDFEHIYDNIFFMDYIPILCKNYIDEIYEFINKVFERYFVFFFFYHEYFTNDMLDTLFQKALTLGNKQVIHIIEYYLYQNENLLTAEYHKKLEKMIKDDINVKSRYY